MKRKFGRVVTVTNGSWGSGVRWSWTKGKDESMGIRSFDRIFAGVQNGKCSNDYRNVHEEVGDIS